MLRTSWEPSHIVYSCISSAIQSKGLTANGDSQQLQICLKYLVTPLKDFHESSSMSYQCPNFRIWMNLDSPHLPTFSVTFHPKNLLWGFCVKLSNSPTVMIGPILGLCHGLYTMSWVIKGSLGGETSVLRTFRMSGKEFVRERVSQRKS